MNEFEITLLYNLHNTRSLANQAELVVTNARVETTRVKPGNYLCWFKDTDAIENATENAIENVHEMPVTMAAHFLFL